MDVGDGGASYGCHAGGQDMTIVNRIMLRFRPIASKPVADSSVTGTKPADDNTEPISKRTRKRKYVRVKKNKELCNKSIEKEKRRDGWCLQFGDHGSVITLQLLPESSSSVTTLPDIFAVNSPDMLDRKTKMQTVKESEHPTQNFKATSQDVENPYYTIDKEQVYPLTQITRMSESQVMVEGMTKAFVDGASVSAEMEKMKNVEMLTMMKEFEHPPQNFKAMGRVSQDVVNFFENSYMTDKGQVYPLTHTRRLLESRVMVEGMTKTLVDGENLRSANMEIKMKNAEMLIMKEFKHPTQNYEAMEGVSHNSVNLFENSYTTHKGQVYPLTQTTRSFEPWMMAEGMTKAYVDGETLGNVDMEKLKNVEMLMMREFEHPTQNFKAVDGMGQDKLNPLENPYTSSDKGQIYPQTQTARTLESWVMVEGMTKAFVDMEIKMKNVEMDTCPWLISDGLDRVQWVYPAYRRMVDPLVDGGPPSEMVVRLVVKEKITHMKSLQCNNGFFNPAFACTVRVVYIWRNSKYSQIMPCDVWKMEFGVFAWRLDTKAALSLGR